MVLDGGEGPGVHTNKDAESLKSCGNFSLTYRGSTGGLGYAHNKIMIVNPNDPQVTKVVFSSGNMTSGTSINHENWNFVMFYRLICVAKDTFLAITVVWYR